eukprot:TRINITY_DN4073_c0_g1_i3.p2 TRINITY_DN4073_c0_g1~~TRINITY_DN4073_c0_g1_i3.p2  ORF type:complete len:146 (-),score=8.23 TRINITY_DN4073_c0_g1_i3:279-716(-)
MSTGSARGRAKMCDQAAVVPMGSSARSATFHIPRSARRRSGAKGPGQGTWDTAWSSWKEMHSITDNRMVQVQAQVQAPDTLTFASAQRTTRCLLAQYFGADRDSAFASNVWMLFEPHCVGRKAAGRWHRSALSTKGLSFKMVHAH